MRWFPALCIALVVYGAYHRFVGTGTSVSHPTGVITAADDPLQSSTHAAAFQYHGYTIEPLADFQITARTLSVEHYSTGRESDLSPVDLALGWGRMSDSAVLKQLQISQGGRFYFWRYENEPPIPVPEIISHSANMHMIPADVSVENKLRAVRQGEIVSLSGYLVKITAGDGWHWQSSLTREDSGAGACEVIWVQQVSVNSQ
ncbi:MAG: hypothetical protein EPO06_02775 [Burkholderiaceae bacterium]|nr:MAG: hypothetical protein EPO06_02775 [Burkholderiaceae bacterium]